MLLRDSGDEKMATWSLRRLSLVALLLGIQLTSSGCLFSGSTGGGFSGFFSGAGNGSSEAGGDQASNTDNSNSQGNVQTLISYSSRDPHKVIKNYLKVFELMPKGLPPNQNHDHAKHLHLGCVPKINEEGKIILEVETILETIIK